MFTGFESLAGSPRGRAERDAPNRLLSSCHTEEIEILTTQARLLKEEEEESPIGSHFLCFFALERKKERKEERELSAVAMALAVPQIMSCCGSTRFATEMALVGPFSSLQSAIDSARDIWWNKVWLCRLLFIPPPLLCGFTHSWKTITESEAGSLQWWWLFFQRDPILFYFSLWICGRSDAIFFPSLCQFVAFISQGNVTEKLGLEKDFSKLRKFCCEIWSEKEPSNGFRGCCEPAIKCKQMVVSDDDGEMILCVRFLVTNKKIVGDCARQCACCIQCTKISPNCSYLKSQKQHFYALKTLMKCS